MPICNICYCTNFIDFNGRKEAQCANCQSLERHRLVREVLREIGFLNKSDCFGVKRALHLAPEPMTSQYIEPIFGSGYYCSDMQPEKYPHCQALKLALPDGFQLFPHKYFDLILHNHVLEHIPGSYQEHIRCFVNILKHGGFMVFTLPGVRTDRNTLEGGELLRSDNERIALHGQCDHYKTFGKDFISFFSEMDGDFIISSINADKRSEIAAPYDPVYIFKKAV